MTSSQKVPENIKFHQHIHGIYLALIPRMNLNMGALTWNPVFFSPYVGFQESNMGVSENSVPLNPMVLLIIIPIKWLFHWEYTLFSDKPIC